MYNKTYHMTHGCCPYSSESEPFPLRAILCDIARKQFVYLPANCLFQLARDCVISRRCTIRSIQLSGAGIRITIVHSITHYGVVKYMYLQHCIGRLPGTHVNHEETLCCAILSLSTENDDSTVFYCNYYCFKRIPQRLSPIELWLPCLLL